MPTGANQMFEPNRAILLRIERAQKRIRADMAEVKSILAHLALGTFAMANELDELEREVSETETVVESTTVLIKGLSDQLKAAIAAGDMGRVRQAVQRLDSAQARLAEAVAANTAAEEETPPANTGGGGGGAAPADTEPSA